MDREQAYTVAISGMTCPQTPVDTLSNIHMPTLRDEMNY